MSHYTLFSIRLNIKQNFQKGCSSSTYLFLHSSNVKWIVDSGMHYTLLPKFLNIATEDHKHVIHTAPLLPEGELHVYMKQVMLFAQLIAACSNLAIQIFWQLINTIWWWSIWPVQFGNRTAKHGKNSEPEPPEIWILTLKSTGTLIWKF